MIAATYPCANPFRSNAPITFSGTITNTGNVTLNNVNIADSPAAAITLATTTLAPGQSTNYSGSYVPSQTGGDKTDTVTASGVDALNGVTVSASASATCRIVTVPSI